MSLKDEKLPALKPSFKGMSEPWPADAQKKAVVLMSGGADSSAAVIILRDAGYSVAGVTMDLFSREASDNAIQVCEKLKIAHFSVSLESDFKERVVFPFCASYARGETPNPCADCNELVKFGLLSRLVEKSWGTDFFIASGHYARIVRKETRALLARAAYLKKDQSYFLAGVDPATISRLLFPLGEISSKEETRRIARAAGLDAAERAESMDICFAGESDYLALSSAPRKSGPIVDMSGRRIGTHSGISSYTLGQRKGLGVADSAPLFVAAIRPAENTVVVGRRSEIMTREVSAQRVNVLMPECIFFGSPLFGKIRSQGEPSLCVVSSFDEKSLVVLFEEPVFAPAPGQRLVLYTKEGFVAASGVIAPA